MSRWSPRLRDLEARLSGGGCDGRVGWGCGQTGDFKGLARLGLDPFAIDVAFLLEEGWVFKLEGCIDVS